jgi:cytochrome c biogenesis protein CcmG/thiol:disulfide interchange protein DsbE
MAVIKLMQNTRRWRIFVAVVLLLGAGWTWLSRVPALGADVGQIPSPRVGFPAPDFALATLRGEQTTLAAQRGNVVVVNLWASWCAPCRAEMPAIQQVYLAYYDHGLRVLAVNSTIQDSEENARAFTQELGLTFPVLLDRDGAVTRRYLVRALPSTFIVDRRGVVRSVIFGGASMAALQSAVEPLLKDAP